MSESVTESVNESVSESLAVEPQVTALVREGVWSDGESVVG